MDLARYMTMAPVLMLVIARFGGMLVMAPVLGESVVPWRLRAMIAIVLAVGVLGRVSSPSVWPSSNLGWAVAIAGEFLIGLAIGYAARLVFVGVELALSTSASRWASRWAK